MMFTIYKITNLINNKIYIGQTCNKLKNRWIQHISGPLAIDNIIQEIGKEKFIIKAIAFASTKDGADNLEGQYIDIFDSINPNFGYNRKNSGFKPKNRKHYLDKIKKPCEILLRIDEEQSNLLDQAYKKYNSALPKEEHSVTKAEFIRRAIFNFINNK